jgi:hypothetical protein
MDSLDGQGFQLQEGIPAEDEPVCDPKDRVAGSLLSKNDIIVLGVWGNFGPMSYLPFAYHSSRPGVSEYLSLSTPIMQHLDIDA